MRLLHSWPPLVALLLLCGSLTRAEDKPPQVDVDEVRRRGDMVVRTGSGHRAAEDNAITEAMQLPADDSHKWFILFFHTPNCGPCNALQRDWKSSSELQAFARPDDPSSSWAHFREFDTNDATQKWRKYKITTFPTIVIQPPLGGQYGDPSTIVFQRSGYDGNPVGLANGMRAAIVQYISRLQQTRNTAGFAQAPGSGGGGYPQPPFPNATPQPVPSPFFQQPTTPLQIPPGPTPATLEQLRACCPGADAVFLLSQVEVSATLEQARTAWQMEGLKRELAKQKEKLEATPLPKVDLPTPSLLTPALGYLVPVMIGGTAAAAIGLSLLGVRFLVKSTGRQPMLNDEQFEFVQAILRGGQTSRPATKQPPAKG